MTNSLIFSVFVMLFTTLSNKKVTFFWMWPIAFVSLVVSVWTHNVCYAIFWNAISHRIPVGLSIWIDLRKYQQWFRHRWVDLQEWFLIQATPVRLWLSFGTFGTHNRLHLQIRFDSFVCHVLFHQPSWTWFHITPKRSHVSSKKTSMIFDMPVFAE